MQPQQTVQSEQVQTPAGEQPQVQKQGNKHSTQNTLKIAEIRDGLIVMQDGSYRAVVMAQSINFDLMSMSEKEGVESSYQGFLNSLYFPIQIQIRSFRVELKSYMEKLQKLQESQDNVLLSLLVEDYIEYMNILTETSNIMDKQFFIIIPFSGTPADLKSSTKKGKDKFGSIFSREKKGIIRIDEKVFLQVKQEMRQRVSNVLESMNQMSVQAVPLNTQELIELFYNAYNPDTATIQHLAKFSDLEGDIITKGDGQVELSSINDL